MGFFSIMLKTESGIMTLNSKMSNKIITSCTCFPHVVNLACQAVLAALTSLNYAREAQTSEEQISFLEALDKDLIVMLCTLIHVVSSNFTLLQEGFFNF